MTETISIKLFKTIQKGCEQLGSEALNRIASFVGSQRAKNDSFMDRSGKPDVYYTSFGWMLSYVLGIRLCHRQMHEYLHAQNPQEMDLIHYAAFVRCRAIHKLMTDGVGLSFLKSIFTAPAKIRALADFADVPHRDPQSPYTRFIWLSLLEDTSRKIARLSPSLIDYCIREGGYTNIKGGDAASTNATVAALAIAGQLAGYTHNGDVEYLRNLQDSTGGFGAAKDAPVPDLLSTATALFALKCYSVPTKYPAGDFIEAHWLDNGGFSATLLETDSDVEYTFYGLLAMGSCV